MGFSRFGGACIAALMVFSAPVAAQVSLPDAGAYLAARAAGKASDFEFSARYYAQALVADQKNPAIMENALTAQISLGRYPAAISLANEMQEAGISRQIPNIFIAAEAAAVGNWDRIFQQLESGNNIGPVVDGLAQGDNAALIIECAEPLDFCLKLGFGRRQKAGFKLALNHPDP